MRRKTKERIKKEETMEGKAHMRLLSIDTTFQEREPPSKLHLQGALLPG